MDKLSEGKHVFDIEIEALQKTREVLDDIFVKIQEWENPDTLQKKLLPLFPAWGLLPFICIRAKRCMEIWV